MSSQVPIPKFGSFKPKLGPSEAEVEEVTSSNVTQPHELGRLSPKDREDTYGDRRRKNRHSHPQHHDYNHHRSHHHSRSRERERRNEVKVMRDDVPSRSSITFPQGGNGLFVIDTRGDEKNLTYGSLHRYVIPEFHRYGNGGVLGCPKNIKIDRDLSDDKGITLSDSRNRFPAKRERYAFAKVERKGARLLRIRPGNQDHDTDVNADFIPLSSRVEKRKRTDVDDEFESEDDHQHYRSIEGKAKQSTDPLDKDFEYETELSSSEFENTRQLSFDSSIRVRNSELSRNVEKHPRDVESWLELINHQDKLLGLGDNSPRRVTQAERKSTAEIKIHMYEKALRQVDLSSDVSLERLSVGLMDEGAKIWDLKQQGSRWEEVTRKYPHSITLWKKYVDFRQTNFSTFGYEEHRTLFSSRIGLLRSLVSEGRHSESELNRLYESVIYTLIRATMFMREAGFRELALAIWQSTLEYTFFSPLTGSMSDTTELFREFWDSEVPRIGEEGCLGWRSYVRDSASSSVPDPRSDAEQPEIATAAGEKAIFENWAVAEDKLSENSREPARTMDDVTENDPYRLILFQDVEPFLIRLSTGRNANLGTLLFNAFLAFCQLPQISLPSLHTTLKSWREDSFVRTELLDYEKNALLGHLVIAGNEVNDSAVFARYAFHGFVNTSETMFAADKWFKTFQPWTSIYGNDSGPMKCQWIRQALQTLSTECSLFAEYYLAFEFTNNAQNIKKVAKSLLKRYPSSLALYNAYAMIEWNRGNQDIARTVYSSAIGMSTSASEDERNNIFLLRKSFVWALLEDGKSTEALQRLLETSNASPAAILKMRQELLLARDHSISTGQISSSVTIVELLAILDYYTSSLGTRMQGDIVPALSVFSKFSDVLSKRGLNESSENELLHQSAARLLYLHAMSGAHRPALIREALTNSLSHFPQNTILLSLFAWNEQRNPLDRNVRSILLTTILNPGTITSHLFAIRHEILHGNTHSQHAAFENAVAESAAKHNQGIWRLYLEWCLRTEGYRKKARDVFYRGVAACPWVKGFMMLGFGELSKIMESEELKGVYKVLVEKELRVHIDLDEILEG